MPISLPELVRVETTPDLSQPMEGWTEVPCAGGSFGVQRCELTSGASKGVELLLVRTDRLQAAICVTRGLGLWKARVEELDLGWQSPVQGPVHPNHVALQESSGLGWLDGFDELLVRCGLKSFGAPDFDSQGRLLFPLHGRIANLPARNLRLELDAEHSLLWVRADVHETRFLQTNLQLTAGFGFALGESAIQVHDRVVNGSATPTTCQMLYHINVGTPVLESGAQLTLDAERVVARNEHAAKDIQDWKTYAGPVAGYEEQVYFFEGKPAANGMATALLTSADASRGFAVHYDTETLPYFTQWKNTVAEADGYVTGLEPGTGFPNPRSFEEQQGRLVALDGGEAIEFRLKLQAFSTPTAVSNALAEVTKRSPQDLQQDVFDPQWCTPRE